MTKRATTLTRGVKRTDNLRLERDEYRIAQIYARSFMGLDLLQLKLDESEHIVMFTGENGAGKTTAAAGLLRQALGGKPWKAAEPHRKGSTEYYEIELTFAGRKRTLVISETERVGLRIHIIEDGKKTSIDSPDDLIREIMDPLSLDPIGFMDLKPAEQLQTLYNRLHLDEEILEIDAQKKEFETQRAAVNRAIEDLNRSIGAYIVQELPAEKFDLDKLDAEICDADRFNATIGLQLVERARLQAALHTAEANQQRNQELIENTEIETQDSQIEIQDGEPQLDEARSIQQALQELIVRAVTLDHGAPVTTIDLAHTQMAGWASSRAQNLDTLRAKLKRGQEILTAAKNQRQSLEQAVTAARHNLEQAPAGEPVDVTSLRVQYKDAEIKNRQIDKRTQYEQNQADLKVRNKERESLQREIDSCEPRKREAIAMGVIRATEAGILPKGLTLAADEVIYNNLPLKQWGQAEQLRITIMLALASNPQVRLVSIANGSEFDSKRLLQLQQMAKELNFYVLMARVDDSGEVGIVLENGRIKTRNERIV